MSELLTRAVIPTNSLFLIGQDGKEALENKIYYMRSSGSTLSKSDKLQPQRWVRVYDKVVKSVDVRFNRDIGHDVFSFDEVIGAVRAAGFADVWVHELRLRMKVKAAPYDFIFRNRPLTKGSEAARYAIKYLSNLLRDGWITKIQARHLPLIEVLSVPRGGHLSPDDIADPTFIKWLSIETGGIVKLKTMRRVDGDNYVDVEIRNGLGE